jgi:hypothetical protein
LVSRLRRVLGTDLQRIADGYRLDTTRWSVDVDEGCQLVHSGERRLAAGETTLADATARRAVDLLTGDLLAGSMPTDWLARAGIEHEALIRRARHLAMRTSCAVGHHQRTQALAHAAIASDPLDESAYRALMLAHHRNGEPALALRAYVRLRQELEEHLGSSPDRRTEGFHLAILKGLDPEPRPVVPPSSRTTASRQPRRLVGRDEILDRTAALWREVASGTFQSLVVRGVPGSGRSALLGQICRHARVTGGAVLSVVCSAETKDLQLHPFAHALGSYCATARPDRVRAAATGYEDVLCELVPELAELLQPDGHRRNSRSILTQTLLVDGITKFVGTLSSQQPVLLALDDLDHADELTGSALAAMRHRLAGSAVAMIVVADTGCLLQPFATWPTHCLRPLSLQATTTLAERLHLGHLAEAVHALTAGHPRFVVEALQAGRQGADLAAELPPRLVELALDRIDRAGSEVRDGLTAIAALGPKFAAVDALRLLPDRGFAVLHRAVAAGLLVADGEHLKFESEMLRTALCAATPSPLRQVLGLSAGLCVPAIAGAA